MSDFDDVGKFQDKFGLTSWHGGAPVELAEDVVKFRLNFLREELTELADAYGMELTEAHGFQRVRELTRQDLPQVADALVDLVYVALGTAHLHRLPWHALFAEVQRANMSKERVASAGESKRQHELDVVKPPGWTAPNLGAILKRWGWEQPK